MYSDPIHSFNTGEYIRHHLTNVVNANGGTDAFSERWVVNVDTHIIKAFGELDIMR